MLLSELSVGQTAVVTRVGGDGALRQHFLDMGLIPGVEVTLVKYAPMGDPMELRLHGYELTLRLDDAARIEIENPRNEEPHPTTAASRFGDTPHPAYGEGKSFQPHYKEEHSAPVETRLQFALVGNQNCGKTTLFNQLTGSNQHVGNFPGVTVDRKTGVLKLAPAAEVTDLPGIYSLSPYSSEEIVSREFILREKPTAVINIVDATNIERNLYLTMQLMELDVPMVLALNMMDELESNGGTININEMERLLKIPVVPISALKNQGVDELVAHTVHVAQHRETPPADDFCDKDDHSGAVHRALHGIMHLIEDHAAQAQIPLRFAAAKLIEGDALVRQELQLDANECEMIEHIVKQMEDERGLDRAAAVADMRFLFIRRLCDQTVVKPHESKEHARSRKIDEFLTGRFTALPIFVAVMALIFWLTFDVVGAFFQDRLADGIDAITHWVDEGLTSLGVNEAIHSLVIDAVFNGVGSVLSFVPVIAVLFFFLSLLEDSGYMARIAFVMDKLLRKIGLSGRSIVPLLIGFGCTVPAVMSTRTLPSERDRRMTILLTPFMSCSAKMPIYAFFTAAFFPHQGAAVMATLYFGGILIGILAALVSGRLLFRGEAVPFVMELPNYRLPGLVNVLRLMWDKAKDFLERAFTVIFIGTLLVWFLQTFDFRLNMVADTADSMLAAAAGLIAPIFSPNGFGDWRISTALISGILAKESVVSTLSVLFGSTAALHSLLTPLSAFSLLVFCLLYTPCLAAIAAVRRELGGRWAIGMVAFQCTVAWLVSLLIFHAGHWLGFS